MIHTSLFEMLDDLSRHVDRMRRDAATIVPESLAAITLRVQADAIERRFLTDEQTGEVFPFGERTRAIWIARVIAQEERKPKHKIRVIASEQEVIEPSRWASFEPPTVAEPVAGEREP